MKTKQMTNQKKAYAKKMDCPYCKGKVFAEATLCKHCRSRLHYDRREMIMAEITRRVEDSLVSNLRAPISDHTAFCYGRYSGNKVLLNQCLEEAKETSAVAAMAEKLHEELLLTFYDIVWGGGDIDPVRLEKETRERFRHPRHEP